MILIIKCEKCPRAYIPKEFMSTEWLYKELLGLGWEYAMARCPDRLKDPFICPDCSA